jgi:glycosyltransferase involved in cell wall biosynthesis
LNWLVWNPERTQTMTSWQRQQSRVVEPADQAVLKTAIDAQAQARFTELAEEGSIVQVGPALSVRGGVSSVEKLILKYGGASVPIRHLSTVEDGSTWHRMRVFLRSVRQLRSALQEPGPLVVHIHFASRGSTLRKALLSWMTLRARRPLIMHAHGAQFDQFFESLPRLVQRLLRRLFSRADCFLVLSSQWRDFFTQRCGLPPARVRILCNPTVVPATVPDRAGRSCVQFLFIGRIGQRKGAFDLLNAFAALSLNEREGTRLVFAGDGEVERLGAEASQFGNSVEVHPWIDESQRDALLVQSDVFVLPSYGEGVPMAILEAMAQGLPIITTPVGGIPDIVKDGCEGLLVTPGQEAELLHAMRTLLHDEKKRLALGQGARARAKTFDVARYSAELLSIYRSLLTSAD